MRHLFVNLFRCPRARAMVNRTLEWTNGNKGWFCSGIWDVILWLAWDWWCQAPFYSISCTISYLSPVLLRTIDLSIRIHRRNLFNSVPRIRSSDVARYEVAVAQWSWSPLRANHPYKLPIQARFNCSRGEQIGGANRQEATVCICNTTSVIKNFALKKKKMLPLS